MTNDAAVACHRVRSAGYAGYGVWRDGDIPIDEAQYWESADSSFYIERAYSATTVAELRAEIAAYRAADESMQEELGRQVSLRMAAERRVADLLQAVRELQIAESDVRIHEAMNPRSRNYRLPIYEAQRQARERLSALTKESP